MTQPAIVIGLGGTGQWVLTHLKHNLLQANNGLLPNAVQLLAYDTDMPLRSEDGSTRSRIHHNYGSLEPGREYHHIGGNLTGFIHQIQDGEYPSIAKWFDADAYMRNLPPASFSMGHGAGRVRAFGRLALLRDLTHPAESVLLRTLEYALRRLRTTISDFAPLKVFIVASLAGGTGSAMFIDVALLVRQLCSAQTIPIQVIGYLALPGVFAGISPNEQTRRDLMQLTVASWRELNRFMISSGNPSTSIDYLHPHLVEGKTRIRRAFDLCYLIDRSTEGSQASADPAYSVFPSIATAIGVMTDDLASRYYTELLGANLSSGFSMHPNEALYSTYGTHAYKLPTNYHRARFSHRLALETLTALLNPIWDTFGRSERITGLSSTLPDNPDQHRDLDLHLLSSSQSYKGDSERATLFMRYLAKIMDGGGSENQSLVQSAAETQVRTTDATVGSLMDFTRFEDLPRLSTLEDSVKSSLGRSLMDLVPISESIKEDPAYGLRRLPSAVDMRQRELFGVMRADGTAYQGLVGSVLRDCSRAQLDVFRHLIRLWLQATLMGSDRENPLRARGGKIGYAYHLIDALTRRLDAFCRFMDDVTDHRAKQKTVEIALQRRVDAETGMRSQTGRGISIFRGARIREAQRRYLEAAQAVHDEFITNFLHLAVIDTTHNMLSYCQRLKKELDYWIEVLATGVLSPSGVGSVMEQLNTEYNELDTLRGAEQDIATQSLIPIMDTPIPEEDIVRFLAALTWNVRDDHDTFALSLELAQNDVAVPVRPSEARSSRANDVLEVKRALLEHAQRLYQNTLQVDTSFEALIQSYADPSALTYELWQHTKALSGSSLAPDAKPFLATTILWSDLRSQEKNDQKKAYVELVRRELRKLHYVSPDYPDEYWKVDLLELSDPSITVLLRTFELIPSHGFRAWPEAMRAYAEAGESQMETRHIFPAEVNAARYEKRIRTTRSQAYRYFHPMVVNLLDDIQLIKEFIVGWASGWIKLRSADGLIKVEFDCPTDPRQVSVLAEVRNILPDPFDTIVSFGRTVQALSAQYPQLTRLLTPRPTDISAQLLQQLQMERQGSTDTRTLTGWIGKYREFAKEQNAMAARLTTPTIAMQAEAYGDLGLMVELLLEEFLGARSRFTPLDFDTLQFFQAASWTVTERPSGYMVCSPQKAQSNGYTLPICVRTFFGSSTVDGPAVQRLYELARLEFDGKTRDRVIMAVTDEPPAASAFGHIYSYRAGEGLAIVVLPSSVMRKALATNTASMELDRQLRRALGNDNLYVASMPVTDFLTFFGRASLIEDMLQTINRGEHIGIFGLRKIGKTSLMWQLKERINRHGVAHVDLQGVSDVADFLYPKVIQELVQDVMLKYPGIRIPDLELARGRPIHGSESLAQKLTSAELIGAFERDLQAIAGVLRRQNPDTRIVLFLDEAERTLPWEDSPGFVGWDQFWGLLRGIAQRWDFLTLVIASVDARINRRDRLKGVDNPMYRFLAHTVFLPPLTEQEDYDMIVGIGKQMGLQWEKSAVEAIHRASGGHPFISREICSLAVLAEPESSTITEDIVVEAVDTWLSDPACMVEQIWSDRLSEAEQQVIVSLTQGQPMGTRDLIKHVSHIRAANLRQAVASLKERHIITMDRTQHRYFITFGVLSRWIEENILDLGGAADD